MTIDRAALLARSFADIPVQVTPREAMLYALGIGFGDQPTNADHLRFVYEKNLAIFPTMPVVLGSAGMWFKDPAVGIDWTKIVHGEQGIRNHRPIRLGEALTARTRVLDVTDKGEGKGAVLSVERLLVGADGQTAATVVSTYLCRGDGGFGGPRGAPDAPWQRPDRAADAVAAIATLPQAALLYRHSGDMNPLHADPDFARKASFERPILHGLCSFAMAARALLDKIGGNDPTRLKALRARFSAPVYPGETIETSIWRSEGDTFLFQAKVPGREVTVLANGTAEIASA
jgi:acyl dehydratase